jgi:hypothetical protein
MKSLSTRIAVLLAVVALAVPLLSAADAPKVAGTWDVVSTTPQGEMTSVLVVKLVDGQPKVEFELVGEKRTVSDEKLTGNLLTFKVEYEGGVYEVEAKVDGDAIAGTWQGGGYSGELKGKRRA